jgi:cyclopropane fatty-acyl-phospholipid synthase-like methyltransferase
MLSTIPYSSAAERNRQPILDHLQGLIPEDASVLEIGSGTGQHAVFFTQKMPGLIWQPSDRQENLEALEARFAAEGNDNILPPLQLDVLLDDWPDYCYDAAFSANTAHIMPWEAVIAMFAGVASHLESGARFCLYGPFNVNNNFTSQSNAQFDAQLRAGDSKMGVRDTAMIESLASTHLMPLEQKIAMPANNFILVFKKS